MPSNLRDDLLHPARVAHASMHQFARNATDNDRPDIARDALHVAAAIQRLMTGETLKPARKTASDKSQQIDTKDFQP